MPDFEFDIRLQQVERVLRKVVNALTHLGEEAQLELLAALEPAPSAAQSTTRPPETSPPVNVSPVDDVAAAPDATPVETQVSQPLVDPNAFAPPTAPSE